MANGLGIAQSEQLVARFDLSGSRRSQHHLTLTSHGYDHHTSFVEIRLFQLLSRDRRGGRDGKTDKVKRNLSIRDLFNSYKGKKHWITYAQDDPTCAANNNGTFSIGPYRDWVVKSFNEDLPYEQFVRLQVAGDLIPLDDPEAINTDGFTESVSGAASSISEAAGNAAEQMSDFTRRIFGRSDGEAG